LPDRQRLRFDWATAVAAVRALAAALLASCAWMATTVTAAVRRMSSTRETMVIQMR
jgi:hypothetical protein